MSVIWTLLTLGAATTTQPNETSTITIWTSMPVLFGGTVAALVTVVLTNLWQGRKSRRENQIALVRDQLAKVYGPLHYFTLLNESLLKLSADYLKVGDAEYAGKQCAPEAQDSRTKEIMEMIEEGNSYVDEVIENNKQVITILRDNWHLVDVGDFECFSNFHVDMARQKRTQPGRYLTIIMHQHLGPIYFMRPEMIDRVKEKFTGKKERLDQLTANRSN